MTIKEYVLSKSANVEFSDLNIKGILLTLKRYDGCINEGYDDLDLDTLINENVEDALTVKGMDLSVAETYMLLSSYVGESENVTRGTTSFSKSKSFGVNDRKEFRQKADEIYSLYGIKEEESNLQLFNSFEEW